MKMSFTYDVTFHGCGDNARQDKSINKDKDLQLCSDQAQALWIPNISMLSSAALDANLVSELELWGVT